jgi:hypothetical protein
VTIALELPYSLGSTLEALNRSRVLRSIVQSAYRSIVRLALLMLLCVSVVYRR